MKPNVKETIKTYSTIYSLCLLASIITVVLVFGGIKLLIPTMFEESVMNVGLEQYEEAYNNDPLLISIILQCNNASQYETVSCVHNYFAQYFQHVNRDDGHMYSPQKAFDEGGLCRDSAAMYCTIFKRMGYECKYVHKENHVIAAVWIDDPFYSICLLDQTQMGCV